jgi:hypothetical protein
VAPRQEAERELQVHECPRVASDLYLTTGKPMPGGVVPQLKREHVGVPRARKREPTTEVLACEVRCELELESAGEQGRGGGESLDQAGYEPVEQHVDRTRRLSAGWRRPGGGGDRGYAARNLDVVGDHTTKGLEVCLTGELQVE